MHNSLFHQTVWETPYALLWLLIPPIHERTGYSCYTLLLVTCRSVGSARETIGADSLLALQDISNHYFSALLQAAAASNTQAKRTRTGSAARVEAKAPQKSPTKHNARQQKRKAGDISVEEGLSCGEPRRPALARPALARNEGACTPTLQPIRSSLPALPTEKAEAGTFSSDGAPSCSDSPQCSSSEERGSSRSRRARARVDYAALAGEGPTGQEEDDAPPAPKRAKKGPPAPQLIAAARHRALWT